MVKAHVSVSDIGCVFGKSSSICGSKSIESLSEANSLKYARIVARVSGRRNFSRKFFADVISSISSSLCPLVV